MTSSLVGSEMCIRDSHSMDFPFMSTESFSNILPEGTPPAFETGVSAVSYTHLTLPTICSV
eukprot:7206223-Prorocentrum_lima.AAC.1